MRNASSPMWRKLVLLVSFTLLLSLLPVRAFSADTGFRDVDPQRYAWAINAIRLMTDKQVLTGYPDGLFRPDQTVSKAEWTVMVHRLFNKYRPNQYAVGMEKISYFTDVPPLHWAHRPIMDMYNASFRIGGYGVSRTGDLAFRPDQALNRLQLAQMLYAFFDQRLMDRRLSENDVCAVMMEFKDVPVRLFTDPEEYAAAKADGRYEAGGLMDIESSNVYPSLFMGNHSSNCKFGDDPLSNVQSTALVSLKANGIMTPNDDGYFRPKDRVTRAEAVTILNRIYSYLKNNSLLSDYTSVELDASGSGGGSAGTGGGAPSSGGGSFNNNPGSSIIVPPNSGGSAGGNHQNPEWSDKSVIRVTDYFNDQGVIVKNVKLFGEIETAVQPNGKRFLTIDMKSQEKVDLYVILDGRVGFVKQEELPLTLPLDGIGMVGLRSQKRDMKSPRTTEYQTTLSVALYDEDPGNGKKRK
ncbi:MULTISPECIES: S-layer homology domain-containing protein [Paenibacillus]|uniref:Uncharacterized protein n=1 Tax=Paenibacillus naphthalenovorans TaxID=162209 RepID=A0A0U2W9J1_9BACL|nr:MULTISPECIES: S-layer homology domain-containing protein [Paenibacillus]ALS24141.1 hypothetical protein IJ22_38030 [Paenibacillus naphthalenovorans]GCL72360.1 S-layer homology domain-containing protein [Paenibacillus naphthalenovorans]